jgi:hypothetical protein
LVEIWPYQIEAVSKRRVLFIDIDGTGTTMFITNPKHHYFRAV